MNIILKNAVIVMANKVISNANLHICNGKIEHISTEITEEYINSTVIDVNGSYILPGLIDIHTDALEFEIIPRPGANLPIEVAYHEIERKMCSCGITTAYHSLYMGFKKTEDLMKSKYSRKELFHKVFSLNNQNKLINHKVHMRFEITGRYDYDLACELLESGNIKLLSVMDHTSGQGQFKNGNSIDDVLNIGDKSKSKKSGAPLEKITDKQLETMFNIARERNIPIAVHDMDTPEQVRHFHEKGANICEFPINVETGLEAVKLGMCSLGGATNILRGGSLNGNLNVKDGIEKSAINGICSDYYLPSILHSIFKLAGNKPENLIEATNLASCNVAKAVGIEQSTGSIEQGKDADLIVVTLTDGVPKIEYTFNKGLITSNYKYYS